MLIYYLGQMSNKSQNHYKKNINARLEYLRIAMMFSTEW